MGGEGPDVIDTSANRTNEMFERLIRRFIKSRNTHSTKTVATKTVATKTVENPFERTLKPCLKSDHSAHKAINAVAAPFLSPEQVETFHRDGVICLRHVINKEDIDALRVDIDQQVSQNPPSETALDLEDIRKEIWGQSAEGKAVTPEKFIQNESLRGECEVQETQAIFEGLSVNPPLHTVSMTQSNAVKTLKTILEAVPDAKPNIDETKPFPVGQFYLDMHQWKTSPNIAHTALKSVLPAICTELLNSKVLQFWGDTTRIKTPNTAQRTSLHQDWAYFPFTGVQSCSVWIALDPSTSENGSPYYIKKSHKWGQTFAANIIIASTQNPLSLYDPLPDLGQNFNSDLTPKTDHQDTVTVSDIVIFDLQPGDIIIHNVLTLHGASGNTSLKNNRRALTLRYCGDDIRYFNKPGALETHKIIPTQQDGDRLNTEIFPQVWPNEDV